MYCKVNYVHSTSRCITHTEAVTNYIGLCVHAFKLYL